MQGQCSLKRIIPTKQYGGRIMEFLMSIFFILILLFLGFVIFWWIGLFVPDDKDMGVLKKIVYTIFGILVFILSPPITFTNIAILLCICIIVILIMKYIAPMLYVKTILFIKKYRKNIVEILCSLLLVALIGCLVNGKIQ